MKLIYAAGILSCLATSSIAEEYFAGTDIIANNGVGSAYDVFIESKSKIDAVDNVLYDVTINLKQDQRIVNRRLITIVCAMPEFRNTNEDDEAVAFNENGQPILLRGQLKQPYSPTSYLDSSEDRSLAFIIWWDVCTLTLHDVEPEDGREN